MSKWAKQYGSCVDVCVCRCVESDSRKTVEARRRLHRSKETRFQEHHLATGENLNLAAKNSTARKRDKK